MRRYIKALLHRFVLFPELMIFGFSYSTAKIKNCLWGFLTAFRENRDRRMGCLSNQTFSRVFAESSFVSKFAIVEAKGEVECSLNLIECWIGPYCHICVWDKQSLKIESGVTVNHGTIIYGDVTISSHSLIAPYCYLSSGTHPFRVCPHDLIRNQEVLCYQIEQEKTARGCDRIFIEEDVWLGVGTTVLKGVVVGRGAVVGANTVINRDVEPYAVVAGSPAKVIGRRIEFKPKHSISASIIEDLPYFYRGFRQHYKDHKTGRDGSRILLVNDRCALALPIDCKSIEIEFECLGTECYYQVQMLEEFTPFCSFNLSFDGSVQQITAALPVNNNRLKTCWFLELQLEFKSDRGSLLGNLGIRSVKATC